MAPARLPSGAASGSAAGARVTGDLPRLGPSARRARGTANRVQAERELRRLMDTRTATVRARDRLAVHEAGTRLISTSKPRAANVHARAVREHPARPLAAYFQDRPLDRVEPHHVEAFVAWMRREGRSPKTTRNALGLLHGIYEHSIRRGAAQTNPVKLADKPDAATTTPTSGSSTAPSSRRCSRRPGHHLGHVERVHVPDRRDDRYASGRAARRCAGGDVDWPAGRVRVRQSYVRGEFGTPKRKRSSRAVPLADRVAGELDRHYQQSAIPGDDDLVFCHPHTGAARPVQAAASASRRRCAARACARSASTTCATPSAPGWPPPGVPMRALQEWMGHRDFKTTLIYADYAPSKMKPSGRSRVRASGPQVGPQTERNSAQLSERKAAASSENARTGTPSYGLWSRWSRVRAPSLTLSSC